MPRNPLPGLALLAVAMLILASCNDRPSGDASVDQPTDRTSTIEDTAPADRVETDEDPTPQTGTGGAIPEADEGASQ
jgi:hypothetical protein